MNELQIFENTEFGQVRTIQRNGEPWFVVVDICRALEIGNPSQALTRLDEDEKMTTLISNEGAASGKSSMSFVNEPGLYTLVLGSRKPEAKAFKRWITHEVIPAIRKTGTYSVRDDKAAAQLKRADAMLLNARTRQFNAIMKVAHDNKLSPIAAEVFGIAALESVTGNRVDYRPPIGRTYKAQDIAQELGVSANAVGRKANEHHLKTDEYGMTVLDKSPYNDKQIPNFRYNERGRQRLAEIFAEEEYKGAR